MSYRSERFNRRMRSIEISEIDPAKNRTQSDGGLGVERMTAAIDYDDAAETEREAAGRSEREERLFAAEMRLADAGKSHLIRVLLLIVENGACRDASISSLAAFSKNWNAARKKYFEHRDRLLNFFKSDSGAHGYIRGHVMPRPASVNKTNMNRCGGRAASKSLIHDMCRMKVNSDGQQKRFANASRQLRTLRPRIQVSP